MALTFPTDGLLRAIQRARAVTLTQTVQDGGGNVVPSAATWTLYDADGTASLSVAATVAADGTMSVALTALQLTLELGDVYQEEWAATIAGVVYYFRRDVAIVTRLLYMPVQDADIIGNGTTDSGLYPDLRDVLDTRSEDSAGRVTIESKRLEAWREIHAWLLQSRRLPWLVMSSEVLRPLHLHLSCALLFRSLRGSVGGGSGNYPELAAYHQGAYEAARNALQIESYDRGGQGRRSDAARVGGPRVYTTGGAPTW